MSKVQVTGGSGHKKNATNAKAREVLGWAPRCSEESIISTAQSLLVLGLL